MATRMVDAGINIFVIKEWMGHKRIEPTLRYAHVKQQHLQDALDQAGEYFAKLDGKSRKSAGPDVPHEGGITEVRRVGKECVRTCRYRWTQDHKKNNRIKTK